MYELKDKFALVTGGGKGIGYAHVRELLLNGIKGVTLVDINNDTGPQSTQTLNEEFGGNKVIFVQADVAKPDQFEDAVKKTVAHWKFLDILINNAGIINEQNWNLSVSVNCIGTVNGTHLGFQYMSKRNGGRGGIVVNTGAIGGIDPFFGHPVYGAAKSFIVTLGRSLGTRPYFDHNAVIILTVCPGATDTSTVDDGTVHNPPLSLCPNINEIILNTIPSDTQTPECVAKGMIKVIKIGSNGSVWVIEGGQTPYEVEFPTRMSMRKSNG